MSTQKTTPQEDVSQAIQEKKNNSSVGQDTKIIAAFSYIWILFLFPLLLKKNNTYSQFHAKQGLILFVSSFILMIIGVVPVLGWIVSFFGWIAIFVLSVSGIVKALQGEMWPMPFLGKYAAKINL